MWAIVLFDLPTGTDEERRDAAKYRKDLRRLGFEMMQRSVYARYRETIELTETSVRSAERALPERGIVSMLLLTDEQYGRISFFKDRATIRPQRRARLVTF